MKKNWTDGFVLSISVFIILSSLGFSQTGWKSTSLIRNYRYNPIVFGNNGFLYALAMDTTFSLIPDYEYAQMNPDGTLKPWRIDYEQGNADSLVLTGEGLSGMSVGTTVYVLGGMSRDTFGTFYNGDGSGIANINSLKQIGSFEAQPAMDTTRAYCTMVFSDQYVYALGGFNCVPSYGGCSQPVPTKSVEFSRVLIDGDWDILGWQYTRSMNVNGGLMYGGWASNGYIYVIGESGFIERARQNTNGNLGVWNTVGTSVPVAGPAILTGDFKIYVIGKGGSVYKTSFDPLTGTIGTWTKDTLMMVVPRQEGYQVAEVWPYLYVLGGKDTTGAFTSQVEYLQEEFTLKSIDFTSAFDTSRWVFETATGTGGLPTISWLSTYNGTTGVMKVQFSSANLGVKMTLFQPQWFSSISANWYELKVRVRSDSTNTPNDLIATGILFNGVPPDETVISAHAYYSLSTGWVYLKDFQESTGGALSMYPQIIMKNNQTNPATLYIDFVEVKEINQPGD